MRVYHGSKCRVEKPELLKGKLSNDYGQGFYCTQSLEMAREWACKGSEPPAYANAYGVYHEMDISRFVEDVRGELEKVEVEPNLRRTAPRDGAS